MLILRAPIGRRAFAEALRSAARLTVLPGAREVRMEFANERRARRVAKLQAKDMEYERKTMDGIRETRHDSEAAVPPFESATPLAARLVHQKIQDEAESMTDADLDALERELDEAQQICLTVPGRVTRHLIHELRAAREVVEAARYESRDRHYKGSRMGAALAAYDAAVKDWR